MSRDYSAPRWLAGAHAQTIYPALFGPPKIALRRERVDTPDGDFVEFDWQDTSGAAPGTPTVVLFHGLEGSSSSHYARALMRRLQAIGWRGVVPHFRGCSGEPNRLPRAYHSGDYAEIGWMLAMVKARLPAAPLYAVGVSLGGSALLNWLGRAGSSASQMVTSAAAVSAPLDLMAAGVSIGRGVNRIYTVYFLASLKPKSLAMAARFPGLLDPSRIRRVKTLWDFDDTVTAPLHGFAGTADYWTRASSKPWLREITVPTLVINARNDPFIPADSLPTPRDVSGSVTLEQPRDGGHVGFTSGRFPGHVDWLPARLLHYFAS